MVPVVVHGGIAELFRVEGFLVLFSHDLLNLIQHARQGCATATLQTVMSIHPGGRCIRRIVGKVWT